MNSFLTLSTHEIAKEIIYSRGNRGICLIINRLINNDSSNNTYFTYSALDLARITVSTEHFFAYDSAAAAYALFLDCGLADLCILHPSHLYFFQISGRSVHHSDVRLLLAETLIAAPDRKIVTPVTEGCITKEDGTRCYGRTNRVLFNLL